MKRRFLIFASVSVLMVVLLGSCIGNANHTTITIAADENSTKPFIELFEETYPDIDIKPQEFTANYDKVLMQFAGGVGPDIQMVWWESTVRFIDAGLFLNLGPYIERDHMEDIIADIPYSLVQLFTKDGDLYGIPYYVHTRAIPINKDYRTEAGLQKPASDWTWDDYYQLAKKLTRRNTEGEIIRSGVNLSPHWGHVQGWLRGTDSQYHKPGDQSVITMDSEEVVKGLEYLQELNMRFRGPMGGSLYDGTLAIGENYASNWLRNAYESEPTFEFVEIPLGPAGKRSVVTNDTTYYINRNTQYPEACWKFMKVILSEEGQRALIASTGLQPARMSMAVDWQEILQKSYLDMPDNYFEPYIKAYGYAEPPIYFSDGRVITEYLSPALDEIINQGKPALPVLKSIVPAANAFLAEHR